MTLKLDEPNAVAIAADAHGPTAAAAAPGSMMPSLIARKIQRRAIQRQLDRGVVGPSGAGPEQNVEDVARGAVRGSGGALPFQSEIQRSFGKHDVGAVRAHTDDAAKAGARAIGAEAFATGNDVAFGQTPTLHTAAHEAAHVVQQRAGVQLAGGAGAVGDPYERHADAVADAVVQGRSSEALLDQHAGVQASTGSGSVQRLEYDELKTGHFYEVKGYTFPLYLRSKKRTGVAGFRMEAKTGPEVELRFDAITKEVAEPTTAPNADQTAQRAVLGAIWDAYARVSRVIEALTPVAQGVEARLLSAKVGAALKREGKAFLVAFAENLVKIKNGLAPQLAQSDLLFTVAAQDNPGTIGETARTDPRSGAITFYKAFFDCERLAQGNTVTHEMVHRTLGVEDQAYRTTRLFTYLKPEYRLQNPDSYVQLLNEIDPVGGDVKAPPGLEVAGTVVGVDAKVLKFQLAVVQHIAQRGFYFLSACADELANGLPMFLMQSAHLKAFMEIVRGNEELAKKKDDISALRSWASTFTARGRLVANALAANVKVVGATSVKEEAGFAGDGELLLTYFTGADKPLFWLFGKLLQKLNVKDGLSTTWNFMQTLVETVEPFAGKIDKAAEGDGE